MSSFSDGHMAVYSLERPDSALVWQAHDLEAWIGAFDYWQPSVVYSGADDCRLKVWDTRTACDSAQRVQRYDMGVTTVQCHPHREHCVAVGSYDETVRLLDLRGTGRTQTLCELNVGGGVWRIKWHPCDATRLAVAAMHAGFATLRVVDEQKLELQTAWNEPHASLAYGVDWRHKEEGEDTASDVVTSCSFYDHLLTVGKL